MRTAPFQKTGPLALLPKAWGSPVETIVVGGTKPELFKVEGDAAVVDISGPLLNRADDFWSMFCDTYPKIRERVEAACASSAKAVVMRFDSPGGDAAGCFELARELRAMAAKHGKPLLSFVDGTCASAAYALACAGDEIILTSTGLVGSVGVIQGLVDQTKLDAAMGVTFAVIASGQRKPDGNPHVAISEGAVAAMQSQVDELAAVFFDVVEELRGIPAASVKSLEAGVFYGASAMRAGLADRVSTWSQLLAGISGDTTEKVMPNNSAKASKYDEAMGVLRAAADGEDEEAAKKAKKAIKAIEGGDDEGADKDEDEKKKEADAKAAKAKADFEEKEKKDDADAKALAANNGLELAREVQVLKANAAARDAADVKAREEAKRAELFAKRPDFSEAQRKTLASLPIASLEEAVNTWPRVNALPGSSAAAMTPGGTTAGSSAPTPAPRFNEYTKEEQEIARVRAQQAVGEKAAAQRGNVLQMPAMMTRADAAARMKELEADLAATQKGNG